MLRLSILGRSLLHIPVSPVFPRTWEQDEDDQHVATGELENEDMSNQAFQRLLRQA